MQYSLIKTFTLISTVALLLTGFSCSSENSTEDEWISLFDGSTLNGWEASENPESFRVEDGAIVADGPRAHLFYVGSVMDHNFENFEFKTDVMTTPGSNSGIYFHTEYQENGWPEKGYEAQVNNTDDDPRKTGSLYAIDDVLEAPASDDAWFTMHITVRGNQIIIQVNDSLVVDYTEPEGVDRTEMPGRILSSGTFALQGHDPESKVYYRNVMVKPLTSNE